MPDVTKVHIGENSPEQVAYRLMQDVLNLEASQGMSRKKILDTYAECMQAVKGYREFS